AHGPSIDKLLVPGVISPNVVMLDAYRSGCDDSSVRRIPRGDNAVLVRRLRARHRPVRAASWRRGLPCGAAGFRCTRLPDPASRPAGHPTGVAGGGLGARLRDRFDPEQPPDG